MNKNKIIWECSCGKRFTSDPFEHHVMDYCNICDCGLDLETYSCRSMGNIKIIRKLPFEFKKERLNKCWTTYGENNKFPLGKKISVSEMDDGHLKAILETQEPTEKMKLLINKEIKLRIKNENTI